MLEAAAQLFASQRFHEVRMEDIAASAGVGKGTLYRYFSDKEDLYRALLARASRQIMERFDRAVTPDLSARRQLVAYVETVLTFFDEQPHVFHLIQRQEAFLLTDDAQADFPWQEVRDRSLQMVLAIFRRGQAEKAFRVRHPDVAALMLLGGLRSVIRFADPPRPARVAEQIVDDFLDGAAGA
jgi:TetR/AcrR family fatty acid metabolism transcriptional regulator